MGPFRITSSNEMFILKINVHRRTTGILRELEHRVSQRLKQKWGLRQISRDYRDFLFTGETGVYSSSACMISSSGLLFSPFTNYQQLALIPFSLFSNGFPVPPLSPIFFFSNFCFNYPIWSIFPVEIHKRNSLIFPANPGMGRVFMCQITSWVSLGQVLTPAQAALPEDSGWGEQGQKGVTRYRPWPPQP